MYISFYFCDTLTSNSIVNLDILIKGMIRRHWEWQLQYQSRLPKEIGGVHYTVLPFVLHYCADSNSFARILFCLTGLGFLAIIF